jgi:hypothetical protein
MQDSPQIFNCILCVLRALCGIKKIKMKILLTFVVSLIALMGICQTKPGWKYTGIVHGGIIIGANGYDYTAQTIQGIQKGPWLLGIGAGIDHYFLPGFPVVAHGQYHYGKRRSKPFAYAQAGPQIPWQKNEWDEKIMNVPLYKMHTGWLAEGGVGYQIPMGKRLKFISSIGYSFKQADYDQLQTFWIGPWPLPQDAPLNYTQNKLSMSRYVLKIGIQF